MDALMVACISGVGNVVLLIISALLKRSLDANEKRLEACENQCGSLQLAISLVRETLPTHYVRRDDFKDLGDNIFSALRRIEDKLDNKVDKP
jgi:hypothetical protein